jgi:fibronectin type 3 domain-containing protein
MFTPTAGGAASGTITFVSNVKSSSITEYLTGTGVTSTHGVDLSWNASTSQVAGYRIYRGDRSGGPYVQINAVLDSNTAYTDSDVVAGQTCFYVTTSVDGSGNESIYSNEVQATMPLP